MPYATASVAAATTAPDTLASILDSQAPSSLLIISQAPPPAIAQWCQQHEVELTEICDPDPAHLLEQQGRFDMAIVAEQLEYMNGQAGQALLGTLRNLHTNAMLVVYQPNLAPERLQWRLNDFIAMGMRQEGVFPAKTGDLAIYSYDLSHYNFKREWNNARFWANPENWGKYWW